jgi:hypothetical protein
MSQNTLIMPNVSNEFCAPQEKWGKWTEESKSLYNHLHDKVNKNRWLLIRSGLPNDTQTNLIAKELTKEIACQAADYLSKNPFL